MSWFQYRIPYLSLKELDKTLETETSLYNWRQKVIGGKMSEPFGTRCHVRDYQTGRPIARKAYFSELPKRGDWISLYWEPEEGAKWENYEVKQILHKDNAKGDKVKENVWLTQLFVTKIILNNSSDSSSK